MAYQVPRRTFLLQLAGLACLSLPLRAFAANESFSPFSFAYVTDINLANGIPDTYKLVHESQLFLQELVKVLNQEQLSFVMFGGDQVDLLGQNEAHWQLFLDIVQGLNCPWNFVLGERDLVDDSAVDKMKTFGPDWRGKGIESNKSYYSWEPVPEVHLIGLDTSLTNSTQGRITPAQLEWLKTDLEANRDKFTLVFSHHPLLPPAPYDGGPPWDDYIVPEGPLVRELLSAYPNVRMAFSGHVPISKIQQEGHIWYVSGPSLNVYPCAYRIMKVSPSSVDVSTHQLNFPALVKKARKALASSNLAYKYSSTKPDTFAELAEGAADDRDAVLSLAADGGIIHQSRKKKKASKKKTSNKPGKETINRPQGQASPAVKFPDQEGNK